VFKINLPTLSVLEASHNRSAWALTTFVIIEDGADGELLDQLEMRVGIVSDAARRNLNQWLPWEQAIELLDATAPLGTVYKVELKVEDGAGNEVTADFELAIRDTSSPILSLKKAPRQDDDGVTLTGVGQPYQDAGASALDSYDGDVSGSVEAFYSFNATTAVVGDEFNVTYGAEDKTGNTASTVRLVRVAEQLVVDADTSGSSDDGSDNSSSSVLPMVGAAVGVAVLLAATVFVVRRRARKQVPKLAASSSTTVLGFHNPVFPGDQSPGDACMSLPSWYRPELRVSQAIEVLQDDADLDGVFVVVDGDAFGSTFVLLYARGGHVEQAAITRSSDGKLLLDGHAPPAIVSLDVQMLISHLQRHQGDGLTCCLSYPAAGGEVAPETRLSSNPAYETVTPAQAVRMVAAVDLKLAQANHWPFYVQAASNVTAFFQLRGAGAMLSSGVPVPLFHAVDPVSGDVLPPRAEAHPAFVEVGDFGGEVEAYCVEYDEHWQHLTETDAANPVMVSDAHCLSHYSHLCNLCRLTTMRTWTTRTWTMTCTKSLPPIASHSTSTQLHCQQTDQL